MRDAPRGREEIYRLVRALRDTALSRNRNFELHATREGRTARRIHRFLRGVELDLRRSSEVESSPRADGGVRLVLELPSLRVRRTVELDADAHAVLLESSDSAARLRSARR